MVLDGFSVRGYLIDMRFPSGLLDEIRARLPISDVVGRRVTWDRRKSQPAKGDFWACCPFHSEKTPSFHVDDRRGIYKCFGCGASGDMFKFVTETEGLAFPEVVERLAGAAGVPLPAHDPQAEAREEKRQTLFDVMEAACRFFEDSLHSRLGAAARGYLSGRELGPDLQARFRIGYAPNDRSALKTHLAGQGISAEQMIEAGLIIAGPDIAVPYDRFRDRVIFPITDLRGRVIAFGGRAMSADVPAKYLNSPDTPLFHKGTLLYNAAQAREAAHRSGTIVAVEGYIDVIALVAAGFEAAVAPLGTALTEDQLRLLWRFAAEPTLCFDGDEAGLRAASRAIDLALPLIEPGKSLKFALLPQGQDPDDLIRSGGRAAMEDVLGSARPLADMLWRREAEAGVFDTPERRAALEARIGDLVRLIGNETVRRHYAQALGERLKSFFGQAEPNRNRRRGPTRGKGDRQPARTGLRGQETGASSSLLGSPLLARTYRATVSRREAVIVGTAINHPRLVEAHFEDFAALELGSGDLDGLRAEMVAAISEDHDVSGPAMRGRLLRGGFEQLLETIDRVLIGCREWYSGVDADPEDAEKAWLQAVSLHRRAGALHKELRAAELALANEPSEENLAWLRDVQAELAKADGMEALVEGFGSRSGRNGRKL